MAGAHSPGFFLDVGVSRSYIFVTTLFAVAAIVLSGLMMRAEIASLSSLGGSDHDRINALQREPDIPPSIRSQYAILSSCDGLIGSVLVLTRPPAEQDSFLQACAAWAAAILRVSPANAFAAAVAAESWGGLKNGARFNEDLILAQRMAPNEGWLAALRVAIAERYIEMANATVLDAESADIALLASSYKGVEAIARRFVTTPAFRDRVTSAVETLPPDVQRRFLQSIRRAAAIWGYRFDA